MDAAKSTFLARGAALHPTREAKGDVLLTCDDGTSTRAHALILSMGSVFFEARLNEVWSEEGERRVAVEDCPAAVLSAIVDFMYGIDVPADFEELGSLLRVSDRLLMEELREGVARRLVLKVSEENVREMSRLAETYRLEALADSCAKVIVDKQVSTDSIVLKAVSRQFAAYKEVKARRTSPRAAYTNAWGAPLTPHYKNM